MEQSTVPESQWPAVTNAVLAGGLGLHPKGPVPYQPGNIDAIRTAVWELERAGYIRREQGRDTKGKMADMVYTIYEQPVLAKPVLENPVLENPTSDNPTSDNPRREIQRN